MEEKRQRKLQKKAEVTEAPPEELGPAPDEENPPPAS